MIDVLVLTFKDLANMGWRTAECLKLLGLNVKMYKGKEHMGYPGQCKVRSMTNIKRSPLTFSCPSLKGIAEEAKVIHFTSGTVIDTGVDLIKKTVVIQYGGRPFVGDPKRRRKCTIGLNRFVDHTMVQHPFLLGQGAKNEVFIKGPVDVEGIKPIFRKMNPDQLVIGHFPSNPIVKGSKVIANVIKDLRKHHKFQYKFSEKRLPWIDHLKRIKSCDVIIECLTPTFGDDVFGEWSAAATEAAACGKIVVTNSFNEHIYEQYHGKTGLVIANNPTELFQRLNNLLYISDEEILKRKLLTHKWVVENHSMHATSESLWNHIYSKIF